MISLIVCYLLGALPVGWIIVWLTKKRDIRYYASGRMGTSNVIRMVGIAAGLVTLALDFTKGYLAVQVVRAINPNAGTWVEAIGGFLAVLGHVFSIFLIEKGAMENIICAAVWAGRLHWELLLVSGLPLFFGSESLQY